MSISTDAMLIVGCKYKELAAVLDEDQIEHLNEYLYNGEIDYASPWYDSDRDYWFVGYAVSKQTNASQLHMLVDQINAKISDFKNQFPTASHLIKISACANVM
jgi:hypothetical protein